jgi:hypothetical protein
MSVNRSMLMRIPIDVTRIIAALRKQSTAARCRAYVRFDRPVRRAPMYALQEAMTVSLACGPRCNIPRLLAPEPHPAHDKNTQHPTPFPDGNNSVKAKCYAIASAKVGSGIKRRRSTHTTSRAPCCSATRTAITPAQLRQVFTVPNDARITVTETKTTYRLRRSISWGWMRS